MTSKVFKATLGASLGNGQYGVVPAAGDVLVADTTLTTDLAAVVAADAVLVADAATPTQAHVTTLDTAVTALNTAYTTFKAPLEAAVAADLAIVINSATVTKKNQLRALLRELSKLVETQLVD